MEIFQTLLETYGPQHWWPAESPWEVMVGAVLTQATSWNNAERAVHKLKSSGLLQNPCQIASMDEPSLAEIVRSAGYYKLKARRLLELARHLCYSYASLEEFLTLDIHEQRRSLLAIPGIGKETADSIILYACRKPIFVVDAYTTRFLRRLDLLEDATTYDRVQKAFMDALPLDPYLFNEYHALIVTHCKIRCRKHEPRCEDCPFRTQGLCRYIMRKTQT